MEVRVNGKIKTLIEHSGELTQKFETMDLEPFDNDSNPTLDRLHQTLASCYRLIEAGDFSKADQEILELVEFLNSLSESAVRDPENEEAETVAFSVIYQVYDYIGLPELDQEVIDALSYQLPRAVARFTCVSRRCAEVAHDVIDRLIDLSNPRDMISILCEALGLASNMFMVPNYFVPLLGGIAKVLGSIRRHHFEQFKVAVPIILNALKAIALDLDVEDIDCEDLFNKTIDIAHSIQAINVKLEGEDGKQSSALFSLFILETMYLVTIGMRNKVSSCASLVLQLSHFLRLCNLSYVGLIMERDIDAITKIALKDDGDFQTGCFSHVKHGSALAVIWGFKSDEIAMAAEADFTVIRRELQSDQTKRWQAVGKMKYIFISTAIPWELKKFAINFILAILDGNSHHISQDKYEDYSIYTPTLYSSLQGIQMVIMYSPEAGLRKHAFEAFKNILGDVPASVRFDILEALIKNNDSSSMIAILLHCVKEEMHAEMRNIRSEVSEENGTAQCTAFWKTTVLEVIQSVLRPPKGGPPDLPEYGDAVLSCLNLYRFILITESSGKTNYTGALLKDSLQRAYDEWLLPLRTLVAGIVAENQKDHDQLASDTVCALNPIELVMYRCIELVEENLKHQI